MFSAGGWSDCTGWPGGSRRATRPARNMTLGSRSSSVPRQPAGDGLVRVLLAGGSAADRRAVRTLLAADVRFTVVGEARNRPELLSLAAQLQPTAVVLNPELPFGALLAIADLMASHPLPVVVYGDGPLISPAAQADLRAAGAIEVVPRSSEGTHLRACLLLAARIRVIRHPGGRLGAYGRSQRALGHIPERQSDA